MESPLITTSVDYRRKSATERELLDHLRACDNHFVPPLTNRIDLVEYVGKLHRFATSFEAWEGKRLIGSVNAYLIGVGRQSGFISNVSVVPSHHGKGVAKHLVSECHREALRLGFGAVELEVSPENKAARRLYETLGYFVVEERDANLLMVFELGAKDE